MKYVFRFQVAVQVVEDPQAPEMVKQLDDTTIDLVVNAEDYDNAKVKATRALQNACLAHGSIFYTHDR